MRACRLVSVGLCSGVLSLGAAAAIGTAGRTSAERGRLVLWNRDPGTCGRQRLVHVDPNSLKLLPGRTVAVPDVSAGPMLSPHRSLAVLDGAYGGRLEFVDPIRMRRAGSMRIGG